MNGRQEVEAVVDQVSEMLHRDIGLRPEPALRERLRRCIRDDAPERGQYLDDYLETLLADAQALQSLLNRVTVQETAFFRHPEHFDVLARTILPTLGPPVTIWSAACANGQEAFSLAMLLEEHGIDGRVIATDLSTEALRRTTAARYSTRELSGLSPDRIARHLTRDGDAWLANSNIRDRISSFQHNLLDPIPAQVLACQIIFCRNVLIYFSPAHAGAFLERVADALPAASLFLGATETIWQLSTRYETVRSGDTYSYRRLAKVTRADNPVSQAAAPSHNPPRRIADKDRPTTGHMPRAMSAPNRADNPRSSTRPVIVPPTPPQTRTVDVALAMLMARAGQLASAAGDVQAAVVAFRKCAYLAPDDPMAHLNLGLALESAGDQPSAGRAYAAARHALTQSDSAYIGDATGGYTTTDLMRLLDYKQAVIP